MKENNNFSSILLQGYKLSFVQKQIQTSCSSVWKFILFMDKIRIINFLYWNASSRVSSQALARKYERWNWVLLEISCCLSWVEMKIQWKEKLLQLVVCLLVQVNFNLISPRKLQKSLLFYGTKVLSSFLVTGL